MRLLFACLLALAGAASALATGVSGPLVTVEWLDANRAKVVVLDVRDEPESFAGEGHIPGSVLVEWKDVRAPKMVDGQQVENMIPAPDVFTALMRRSGVNADSAVVVVARGRSPEEIFLATRLHWQLRYYGHDDVAVLDGGVSAWAAAGRTLARGKGEAAKPGTWSVKEERRHLLATTEDVKRAIETRSHKLADARPIDNYLGTTYAREVVQGPGHLPGAKYSDPTHFLLAARPTRFRSIEELKQLVDGLGFGAGSGSPMPTIAYCNTGDWASGAWFVLHELMGKKDTALYDGSMHLWTKDPSRPRTQFRME